MWLCLKGMMTRPATIQILLFLFTFTQEVFKVNADYSCGTRFSGTAGSITSPNYPVGYPSNLYCSYFINIYNPSIVIITFHAFSTESCCDFLRIHCSTGEPDELQSFSGTTLPPLMHFRSCTQITIQFQTDNSVNSAGFYLTYSAIAGGITTAPENVVARSDRPEPIVLTCKNNITVDGIYPRWTYSRNGIDFTSVTYPNCSPSSQNSLRGITCQRSSGPSGNVCNITIASAYVSDSVGVFTCTDTSSASAVVAYLESSMTTDKDQTGVVKGENVTVTCLQRLRQAPSPVPQILISVDLSREQEYIPKAPDSTSSVSMIFTNAPSEIFMPYICNLKFLFPEMNSSLYDTKLPDDITLRTKLFRVLFWPEQETMTVTGDLNGKMTPNGSLMCHAPANPKPIYTWLDLASGKTTRGPTIRVSHSGTYICTATNDIREQIYNASKSITVQVEAEYANPVDIIFTVLVILAIAVLVLVAMVTCAWRKITLLRATIDRKVDGNTMICGDPEIKTNEYFMRSITEATADQEVELYEEPTLCRALPSIPTESEGNICNNRRY